MRFLQSAALRVLELEQQSAVRALFHLADLTPDQPNPFSCRHLLQQGLVAAGCPTVDVVDRDLGLRKLLLDVICLLQRGEAANVRAVGQVVHITRARTLDERDRLGGSAVGRPQDLALGGAPG